jgi:hypothetical protein
VAAGAAMVCFWPAGLGIPGLTIAGLAGADWVGTG